MTKIGGIRLAVEGLIFILFFIFTPPVLAKNNNQFITIVNPVRISAYTKNPSESLKAEYQVIKEKNLSATWLLRYDALINQSIDVAVKTMDKNQEFGVFLEVTPDFAKAANIDYHDTGFWHHANSVFLSGYTQAERIKLIDTVFEKFKQKFGYYPTSVGSWWTDSYSLAYLKEKYGITANLVCSDQFSTDGYQIWGQPWQVPYYPSRFHTAILAVNESVKLDLVNIQWAARDPLNGYYNSRYSTQDYLVAPRSQDISYFEKLVKLYSLKQRENKFGQITIGLEADLGPAVYEGEFRKQIDFVSRLQKENEIQVLTMKDFANWYRKSFPDLSPLHLLEAEDLLGGKTKAVWYQGPRYRLFYTIDLERKEITIRDLRIYKADYQEPYYLSPNRNFNLSIYVPAVFDEINLYENVRKLPAETDVIAWVERVVAKEERKVIPRNGVIIRGLTPEAIHFFKQKKAVLELLSGRGWEYFKKVNYLTPQGEIYALKLLSSLPRGKVLVYDNECLQCEYHTKYKPPAFANLKSYVQKYGKHPIIYNSSVFKAKTREEAKKEFDKLKVKYVYLVKFESYFEQLPFSPGDLGVEKIYANANAEIWRVTSSTN